MDELIRDFITCPITYNIFSNPVLCSDGIIYESESIEKWLENSNKSPWTKEILSTKDLIPVNTLKRFIDKYLELNPDEISERYESGKTKQEIRSLIESDIKYILNFQSPDLLTFFKIIHKLSTDVLQKIFKNYKVVKHIVDNINVNISDINGTNLIHYVACYSSYKIIKLLCDINTLDMMVEDSKSWTMMHYLCNRSESKNICQIIKYIIDNKNVYLHCQNDDGWTPIHFIFYFGSEDIVKYFVDINLNIDIENNFGIKPVDLLMARYSHSPKTYRQFAKKCNIYDKFTKTIIEELSISLFEELEQNELY
jgi:hypothetical protein